MRLTDIAKALKIVRAPVYRVLAADRIAAPNSFTPAYSRHLYGCSIFPTIAYCRELFKWGSGQTPRLGPQYANERTMFAIDWLRRGVPVLREMSLEPTVENAMAAAEGRVAMIRIQLQDREPDTFRVVDAGGLIVGHSSFRRAGRHS